LSQIFKTGMERAIALEDARAGNLPDSLAPQMPHIATIAASCLRGDQALRPSASEVSRALSLGSKIREVVDMSPLEVNEGGERGVGGEARSGGERVYYGGVDVISERFDEYGESCGCGAEHDQCTCEGMHRGEADGASVSPLQGKPKGGVQRCKLCESTRTIQMLQVQPKHHHNAATCTRLPITELAIYIMVVATRH